VYCPPSVKTLARAEIGCEHARVDASPPRSAVGDGEQVVRAAGLGLLRRHAGRGQRQGAPIARVPSRQAEDVRTVMRRPCRERGRASGHGTPRG
jgi:hypothetical protein